MDTGDIILGGLGIAVLGYAYSKYGSAPAANVPKVAVSPASWAAIMQDPNRQAYRKPDATPEPGAPEGEWDSMCGTFGIKFPNACGTGFSNVILSWFKGLDLNPVHNQSYARDYFQDIIAYSKSGLYKWPNWEDTPTGILRPVATAGIYGRPKFNVSLDGINSLDDLSRDPRVGVTFSMQI